MSDELKDILSNLNKDIEQQKLLDYLNKKLSAGESHELEKQMADDEFMNDAVEGLEEIKNFKATFKRPDGSTEPMGEQPYELAKDRKTVILNNTGRADDKFPIIELSDSILKINIFYSDKAYMVFKRMD